MLLAVVAIGFTVVIFQLAAVRLLLVSQIKQQAILLSWLESISSAEPEEIAERAAAEYRAISS